MSVGLSNLTVPAWLVWLSRLVVAGVFVAAAVPKLMDPVTFAEDVANYDSFPEFSRHIIAAFIPVLELVAAVALLVPRLARGAVVVVLGLDIAFIALIASVLARGIDIRCGCFGGAAEEAEAIGWSTLLRDVALLAPIILAGLGTDASSAAAETTLPDGTLDPPDAQ